MPSISNNTSSGSPDPIASQATADEQTTGASTGAFEVTKSPEERMQAKGQIPVKPNGTNALESGFVDIAPKREIFQADTRRSVVVLQETQNNPAIKNTVLDIPDNSSSIQNTIFNNPFTRLVAVLPTLTSTAVNFARNAPQLALDTISALEKHKVPYAQLMDPTKALTPETIKGLVNAASELAGEGRRDSLQAAFDKLLKLDAKDLSSILSAATSSKTATDFERLLIAGTSLFLIGVQATVESRYTSKGESTLSWFDRALLELSKVTLEELNSAWSLATTVQNPLFSCMVMGAIFLWKASGLTIPTQTAYATQAAQTIQSIYQGAQRLFGTTNAKENADSSDTNARIIEAPVNEKPN